MKWTKEKPTEPGWWNYRHTPKSQREVFEVVNSRKGMKVFNSGGWVLIKFFGLPESEWAGPIPEPTMGVDDEKD